MMPAQDQGGDGPDRRIEDDDGDEDGQDLPVRDGEREHAPGRALLDPVLQDGPVLAEGAHAAKAAAAPTSHAVSAHTPWLQPTVDLRRLWRRCGRPNVCPTAVCRGIPGGLRG